MFTYRPIESIASGGQIPPGYQFLASLFLDPASLALCDPGTVALTDIIVGGIDAEELTSCGGYSAPCSEVVTINLK